MILHRRPSRTAPHLRESTRPTAAAIKPWRNLHPLVVSVFETWQLPSLGTNDSVVFNAPTATASLDRKWTMKTRTFNRDFATREAIPKAATLNLHHHMQRSRSKLPLPSHPKPPIRRSTCTFQRQQRHSHPVILPRHCLPSNLHRAPWRESHLHARLPVDVMALVLPH